jgi:hypothetical protein
MHAVRAVATPEEAEAVLEYFNGFHDGFIKQLTLTSHDYFEARGTQVCSGRLDLELSLMSRSPSRSSGVARLGGTTTTVSILGRRHAVGTDTQPGVRGNVPHGRCARPSHAGILPSMSDKGRKE